MDIVAKAREFAETKHLGQKKKYVEQPYFKHVEAVANILQDAGIDDTTTLAAAYLHDVVEKSDTKHSDIARDFGADVAELVFWLTDPDDSADSVRTLSIMPRGSVSMHRLRRSKPGQTRRLLSLRECSKLTVGFLRGRCSNALGPP